MIDKTTRQKKTIIEGLEVVKAKIRQCYSNNPLQFWDK